MIVVIALAVTAVVLALISLPAGGQAGAAGRSATPPPGPLREAAVYAELRIVQPRSGSVVMHDDRGTVRVVAAATPALRARDGHRIRALLDGALASGAWSTPNLELQGVERGAHTLQLVIVEPGGDDARRVAISAPVEFFMWQGSRLFRHAQR
jgi:hypothetical protein